MINPKEPIEVSKATLNRLPSYLRYLYKIYKQNIETVSSTNIADALKLNSVQIRKDIALVSSVAGKPKTGFQTKDLISDIESFLGYDNSQDAVIVGIGGLGMAILGYGGFEKYGLNIAAGFDTDAELVDKIINGKKIFNIDILNSYICKHNIKIGIIAVPNKAAQQVADLLVESGIKAIWNFANTHLQVPKNISLKNEDLAASLALLSMKLKNSID